MRVALPAQLGPKNQTRCEEARGSDSSTWTSYEDELKARAVRGVAHLLDDEPRLPEPVLDLVSLAEADGRGRDQRCRLLLKEEVRPEADEWECYLGDLDPGGQALSRREAREAASGVRRPSEPGGSLGVPGLEDKMTAQTEDGTAATENRVPLRVICEDLGNVSRHSHQVNLGRESCLDPSVDPAHRGSARLLASYLEGGGSRVHRCHAETTTSQSTGEVAGAATEVENRTGAELFGYRHVVGQVVSISIDSVVDLG